MLHIVIQLTRVVCFIRNIQRRKKSFINCFQQYTVHNYSPSQVYFSTSGAFVVTFHQLEINKLLT